MSGCNLCHVPLRFGNRSGNNIDVYRIRTGNMTCYSCLPYIPPPRSSGSSRFNKVLKGELLGLGKIKRLKIKCRRQIVLGRRLLKSQSGKKRELQKKLDRRLKDIFFSSGVYGIWRNDRLIYVGESKSVISRIFDGHFRLLEVLPPRYRLCSPIPHILTKENKHRFKWGYIHKEEDLTKRLIIENQYVSMYTPRYNHPYKNLPDNEYESLVVSLEGRDVGTFTLEVDEYYPVSIRKIKGEIMKDYHKYVSIKSTP